jgi:hypothetical protein
MNLQHDLSTIVTLEFYYQDWTHKLSGIQNKESVNTVKELLCENSTIEKSE